MDFLTGLRISASAMKAHRKQMGAISSNIANAQTTRTAEGGPYRPKEVVFGAEAAKESFGDILEGEMNEYAQKVHATEVISSNRPPILKYEPNHPDANDQGYVAYPDVNVMKEMADMISASRSYESNISAFNTTKSMAVKALELGR